MKFDGMNFRVSKTVVALPVRDEDGNLMPYVKQGGEMYVAFGRVVKEGTFPKGSIKTQYKWKDKGTSVYAKEIKLKGHSLTNMAYGEDGKTYLMYNGKCFISSN